MHRQSLLIRADASLDKGTGHVMRMIALAQAWRQRGGEPHLAFLQLPPTMVERLQTEGIQCHQIDAPTAGSQADAEATLALASQLQAKWVFADGYDFNSNFQQTFRRSGIQLAVMTDFDFCEHWACDLIVNQNPHAVKETYASSVRPCRRLLGTRYALLRREFLTASELGGAPDGQARKRLLVTLGGSDVDNATGRVLRLLEACAGHTTNDPMEIRVLVGAANPHKATLDQQASASRHAIAVLTDVTDMPAQYRWADGIISAGGSSCWEWLYFGLRGAILVIADNQQPVYRELTDRGIAIGLGTANELAGDQADGEMKRFLVSVGVESPQPTRFRDVVDGHGASRLAAALDSGVWLRPAVAQDRELYFQWANDATVRSQSLTTETIAWSSHCDWFAAQLASPEARLLVGMRNDQPVGQIRFNRTPQGDWNIGFSVAAEARGSGLGRQLLQLGTAWMTADAEETFVATVRMENEASARCFHRLGWQSLPSRAPNLLQFRKTA